MTNARPAGAPLWIRLADRARRRQRVRLAWAAMAVGAGLMASLVAWEAGSGGAAAVRAAGYALAALAGLAAAAAGVRAARAAGPAPASMVERVERLFPQTRGALLDARDGPATGGLAAARAGEAAGWLERRGLERLDGALAEEDRAAIGAWRRRALVLGVLALAVVAAQPAAGRRTAAALAGSWSEGAKWDVSPGDEVVEYGGSVEGRVRYRGPAGEGPLAVEWREPGGAWRSEPLGAGPSGAWRWQDLRAPREYRARYGDAVGPVHRLTVATPFLLRRIEGRGGGGAWGPVEGRSFPAGQPLELRGSATGPAAWAEVRTESGDTLRLAITGAGFQGVIRPPAGAARVVIGSAAGRVVEGRPFHVAAPGAAFVSVLAPESDPAPLEASSVALTVRAGAGAGLVSLVWETADGGRGELARVVGARDTTVTALAAVAAGRAPGDTVRYRVVATPRAGRPAASAWRRAVVPAAATLREDAAEERAAAGRSLDSALAEAREGTAGAADAERLDERVKAAADSLARALDRTLADPGLDPDLAERLESARRMLEGAAGADLAPRAGLPPDPAIAAEARAATIEAIREQVREMEARIERAAAAEELSRLADAQRALAEETRATPADELGERIAGRQERLEEAAIEAAETLGEAPSAAVRDALQRARAALQQGRSAEAADAQEAAAGQMQGAAEAERESAERDDALDERRKRALDRAGGESLYLADAQRRLAEEGPSGADRAARQDAVTRGLERTLDTMVEAIGGQPAAEELAGALTRAVAGTRYAREALGAETPGARGAGASQAAGGAALADAADALADLSRALLTPGSGGGGPPGPGGSEGESGSLSQELAELAEAQRALADARGSSQEAAGGNPDAPMDERGIAEALGRLEERLAESGIDPAVAAALTRSAEETAARMERGLAGARTETELRSLAERLEDLSRALERAREERRRSEPARPFVPVTPPDLPPRVENPRLDAEAAMEPWRDELPRPAGETARRYLERLEDEGVRDPEAAP